MAAHAPNRGRLETFLRHNSFGGTPLLIQQSLDCDWNDLLDAARQGDEQALGQVCEQMRNYLLLTADRGLYDGLRAKLGASDIVQQAMLEAHQDFDRFAGSTEEEFRAWLVKIVEHTLLDAGRRYRQTQQRDLSREVSIVDKQRNEIASPQATPSSLLCRREQDEALLRAVNQLSPRRRQIIELRHRQGWPYEQIALELGMTEVATRKLWSRTVDELRKKLAASDGCQPTQPR